MQHNGLRYTPGIRLFGLFVLVLTAAPRMNLKFGSLPIYAIDVLMFFLLLTCMLRPRPYAKPPFSGTISIIFFLALSSELLGVIKFGTVPESIYMTTRSILAFSAFYVTIWFVRTTKDLQVVLVAATLGLVFSSLLMILSSLPMTRAEITDLVFAKRFLEPAATELGAELLDSREGGIRGRTLVGVSIIGATFVNICWPLAAMLLRWPWPVGPLRVIAMLGCLIAPMAVLMSYSRGPIIGTSLILLAALFFGMRHVRRQIVFPILVVTFAVTSIGIGSQMFFFERLTKRTAAMLESPTEDRQESERILAYVEPFQHIVENPEFVFVGEGITVRYASSIQFAAQTGKATHAVFAIAYYSYGLLASVLYLFLLFQALLFSARIALQRRNSIAGVIAQPLFLSVVALIPWAAFGHAIVSTPRGSMIFFLVLGLVAAMAHLRAPQPVRAREDRMHFNRRRLLNAPSRDPALG